MQHSKLDILIHKLENYLECWKQFNQFLILGRGRKYTPESETEFLELKSLLVQELELILAAVEVSSPTREEIHSLVGNVPSMRYLAEMNEGGLHNLESQWHKIYIGWYAILGQLKVKQHQEEPKSGLAGMFAKKK